MQSTKLELIRMITEIQNEELLGRLKEFLKEMEKETKAPSLSKEETRLLLKINEGLPGKKQLRYSELLEKLAREKISRKEHKELLQLTALAEEKNAERLKYLVQLAQLWQTSVGEVMDRLGIKPPPAIHA